MTQAAIAISRLTGAAAGQELGARVLEQLGGEAPHALIVFASPGQDHGELLSQLTASCRPDLLVGCSSAGEFTSKEAGVGMTCVVGLHAPEMRFSAALGRGLCADRVAAAEQIVAGFAGLHT